MQRSEILDKFHVHSILPTPQRLEVASVMLEKPQHLSADQIIDRLRAAGSSVSKATVYNTLNQFTKAGLLREVTVEAGRAWFDTNVSDHHHFYAPETGELHDIDLDGVSIKGLPAVKCDGGRNIPDGEVYTAPVRDSMNGHITYNAATMRGGIKFQDIRFEVKNGKIVKATCEGDEAKLNEFLRLDRF